MKKQEISILNSLKKAVSGIQISKSLRHYNIVVKDGDNVTLVNSQENLSVDAKVASAGDYDTNTIFIVS